MKKNINIALRFIVSLLILSLIFSWIYRILSLTLNHEWSWKALGCFFYGFQFDLPPAFFTVWIGFFFILILWNLKNSILSSFLFILFSLLFVIQFIVSIGDIYLLASWGTIFNIKVISFLANPLDVMQVISNFQWFLMFVGFIVFFFLFYFIYRFLVSFPLQNYLHSIHYRFHIVVFLIFTPLVFLVSRGGFREIPLNQSDAFFCNNKKLNLITINSVWNFANTFVEYKNFTKSNPYDILDSNLVNKTIAYTFRDEINEPFQLWSSKDTPNVLIITMEGVQAEFLYDSALRSQHVMPFLETMLDNTFSFPNCYSIGFRTDQGISALLSGTFSTPVNNVTDNVSYLDEIPSIISSFHQRNYNTNYLFGGDVEFGNIKAYLQAIGVQNVLDDNHFPNNSKTQKLGVPDQILFDTAINLIQRSPNRFFLQIMTQSTHEPYDFPDAPNSIDESELYTASAHYLDSCLAVFFSKMDTLHILDNTVVIFVSDHAHYQPNNYDIASTQRYHIPLLIYYKKMNPKYVGKSDPRLFRQNNFPATLLHLLGWNEKNYLFYSKNHFSDCDKFSFSVFVSGYLYQTNLFKESHEYTWNPVNIKDSSQLKKNLVPLSIMQYVSDKIIGK